LNHAGSPFHESVSGKITATFAGVKELKPIKRFWFGTRYRYYTRQVLKNPFLIEEVIP
jgi:hypothetical protein